MADFENFNEDYKEAFTEKLIKLSRVAKVVKGGRRFSFAAMVAVGDNNGSVGIGYGKASELTDSISKANQHARKNLIKVNLSKNKTLPHETIGKYKCSQIIMKPAVPGTGVIAGGAVRMIMEAAGVKDVLTKIIGSKNQLNVAKATFNGLLALRNLKDVANNRGKKIVDLF